MLYSGIFEKKYQAESAVCWKNDLFFQKTPRSGILLLAAMHSGMSIKFATTKS